MSHRHRRAKPSASDRNTTVRRHGDNTVKDNHAAVWHHHDDTESVDPGEPDRNARTRHRHIDVARRRNEHDYELCWRHDGNSAPVNHRRNDDARHIHDTGHIDNARHIDDACGNDERGAFNHNRRSATDPMPSWSLHGPTDRHGQQSLVVWSH